MTAAIVIAVIGAIVIIGLLAVIFGWIDRFTGKPW